MIRLIKLKGRRTETTSNQQEATTISPVYKQNLIHELNNATTELLALVRDVQGEVHRIKESIHDQSVGRT